MTASGLPAVVLGVRGANGLLVQLLVAWVNENGAASVTLDLEDAMVLITKKSNVTRAHALNGFNGASGRFAV